ncbi:YfbM family protein [Micromonospora yasonensis]|uniref:YfbM family protein n=1 Tax=Micromonospora yasonensis TaxID=1128667 RepID=UPI002232A64D|nr:YfbM family protein [Micromonospora yasonensis]MCW3841402.1 YfbM family protein [Micromonospora yasonensis]
MTLGFTRVTQEQLDRAYTDPDWAEKYLRDEDLPGCYLEKAWAGIQFLLDAAGVSIDLYEDGCLIDKECIHLGWHAGMVADAARDLSATPFEALAAHFDPAKMSAEEIYPYRRCWDDDDLDYLREQYVELVEFFVATAASGGAAIRTFSF